MNHPPPPPGPASWMLFCERERPWSAAVRSLLRREGRHAFAERVVAAETPPLIETLQSIDAAVLVGIEFTHGEATDRLRLLWRLGRCGHLACVALVAPPLLREAAEPMLTEAGARLVIGSPRDARQLITLHDRHAGRYAARRPADPSLARAIRRRLPWQPPPWAIG